MVAEIRKKPGAADQAASRPLDNRCDDSPHLLGASIKDAESMRPWRAFLAAMFGLPLSLIPTPSAIASVRAALTHTSSCDTKDRLEWEKRWRAFGLEADHEDI